MELIDMVPILITHIFLAFKFGGDNDSCIDMKKGKQDFENQEEDRLSYMDEEL